MSNLVLYRKYRPKSFSEIVGQENVVKTLINAIEIGSVSHAYLFTGPRGSGKTSIARILAKAVNCQNRKGSEPCNSCSSCEEINSGRAIDLIEIDAASNRGVDEMRELRDGIKFSPVKSKYKVFIIDESHQLTKEAANALLKTLEEPPAHAIFILATTELHKMIPTILSRCQRFDFRKLTVKEIVERLEDISKKEKITIEKAALELIALNSGGAIRDAEGLLGQAITFSASAGREGEIKKDDIKDLLGMVDVSVISILVDLMVGKNGAKAVEFLNETLEKGFDLQELTKSLIRYLRQALLLKIDPELLNPAIIGLTGEEQKKIMEQIKNVTEIELQRTLKLLMEAENKIKYSSIPQLPLELAIIESLSSESK
ncbi:MAG: DNA polymerase III subunit gamma/tau [Candidatus Parcubacteria bacterium]|nr:DNA polymerase III subunit gamma/tau [Candidatus Parcubacteria bacterium]